MRVLLVSQEYPPETGWGGIGTYLGLHAPALAAAGHVVHVLSVVAGQGDTDGERDGVVIHRRGPGIRLRGPGRLAPQSWARLELARQVSRRARGLGRFDVVEAPDWMAEGLFLRRQPMVVRLHSSAAQIFPFVGRSGADARAAIALEFRAMRRADLLVASKVQADVLHQWPGNWPPLREIPYPVELSAPREPWEEGPPTIVFAGRFEPRKGPDLLVEAMPRVLREVPEARLRLVGRDTDLSGGRSALDTYMRRAQELGVAGAIEVVDEWGREAVEAELRGAAVCAVPSRWESFGYVAAEALAGATPTVVSSWPSLVEIVGPGETETIVSEASGDAWAAALLSALGDPAAARARAERGRERLRELASPERVAALTVAAYREVTAGPARAGARRRGVL